MKKIMMCFAGAMMIASLAACTPTAQKANTEADTTMAEGEMMETQAPGGAWDKVPDPTAESVEVVSIYSTNEDATDLERTMSDVKTLDAQSLVDKLIENGTLEEGTTVLGFETTGEGAAANAGPGAEAESGASEGTEKTGVLDLSQIPEADADKEQMILSALGNTFIDNFELDKLKLLVNGEEYSSEFLGEDGSLEYYSGK